jgi:hypothetical protein
VAPEAVRPVHVEVLGRVRAWRDGQELSLGPPRQRAVLAVLALRANHVVSRDEIVDGVWGERPPASAVNGVHLYVSALRRVLADERPGRLLAGSGPAGTWSTNSAWSPARSCATCTGRCSRRTSPPDRPLRCPASFLPLIRSGRAAGVRHPGRAWWRQPR